MDETNALPSSDNAAVRVFTPPKSHLWIGVASATLFLIAAVGFVAGALINPDGSFARPVTAAITFGVFYGGLTLLGVYLIVASRRMKLLTTAEAVQVVGVFRTRTFRIADVTRAVWRRWPQRGSLVVYCPAGRVPIDFASYVGGRQLSQHFREKLPLAVQERYDQFETACVPTSEAFQRRLCRERRITAPLLYITAVLMVVGFVWLTWFNWKAGIIYGVFLGYHLGGWGVLWRRLKRGVRSAVAQPTDVRSDSQRDV